MWDSIKRTTLKVSYLTEYDTVRIVHKIITNKYFVDVMQNYTFTLKHFYHMCIYLCIRESIHSQKIIHWILLTY